MDQPHTMEGSCSLQPQDHEGIESWLDDHWDFTHSYFVRKATRLSDRFLRRLFYIKPNNEVQ